MQWLSNGNINTAVILTFFAVWVWSEIVEYKADQKFQEDVEIFMTVGDRFTNKDGDDLREAIATNKRVMAAMNRRMESYESRMEELEYHIIHDEPHED